LNPPERVFELIRAGIEGVVYPSIEDTVAAVEALLTDMRATGRTNLRVAEVDTWRAA
jgi:hypothetical protein